MKYNLHVSKRTKIFIYILLICLVVALNALFAWLTFPSESELDTEQSEVEESEQNQLNTGILITSISFILECGGLIYFMIQDMLSTEEPAEKERQQSDNSQDVLPFVDRTELLKQIVKETINRFEKNEFYYEFNIKYGEKNGKSRFARRLMEEFQQLRKNGKTDYNQISKKAARKIGKVYFVTYLHDDYKFERDLESLYCIKGKKNIIIVNNYTNKDFWKERFRDKNVFFIKLNYITRAEDKLLFNEDKINELLKALLPLSKFNDKFSEDDIPALSSRLSQLSDNNIGKLVQIIQSDDFNILIDTDKIFLDFYFNLRNAKYIEAKIQYDNIHLSPADKKIYSYKLRYEGANLTHFLNDYEGAFKDLDTLDGELISDYSVFDTVSGQKLHFDIVILQSHIQKHIGDFVKAKQLLLSLSNKDRNLIWRRANFAIDIFRMNELDSSSREWKECLTSCLENMREFCVGRVDTAKNSNFYFYETYYPIVAFYESRFNLHEIGKLIETEEEAIIFYESNERRYLTNCLFIKAEFLRIDGNLKDAKEYYARCYQVYLRNGDKDILYLVAITERYVEVFHNHKMRIVTDLDKVLDDCRNESGYHFHNQLISKLEEAKYDKKSFAKMKQHFATTINPIP